MLRGHWQREIASMAVFGALATTAFAGFESPPPGAKTTSNLKSDKLWDITVRTFVEGSSNVQVVTDGDPFFAGDQKGNQAGITANAVYRAYQTQETTAGVAVRLDRTANSADSKYNLTAVSPTLFVNHKTDFAGMPATIGGSYAFRYETAKIAAIGATTHTFSLNGTVRPMRNFEVSLGLVLDRHKFEVDFPTPSLDDRSGKYHALTLGGQWWFNDGYQTLNASYTYARNNANGRNFDYKSHAIAAKFKTVISGPVYGSISLGATFSNYRGFISGFIAPPGRERMTTYNARAQLIWVINKDWLADAYVSRTRHKSNQTIFEGTVKTAGIGITRKF